MPRACSVLSAGLLLILASGCASAGAQPAGGPPGSRVAAAAPTSAVPTAVPSARVGAPARSTRVRFEPKQVDLPGGTHAAVEPARTVDGELKVPENVRHVGWWDGSAYVGDPFGTTVIAGHVDSATEGIGYFARLLRVRTGDVVTVRGGGHRLGYRVTSVHTVAKQALATDGQAFDQIGNHQLVLITCTGNYRRDRGGYDRNLVVTAEPLGLAR